MQDKNLPDVKKRLLALADHVGRKGIRGLAAFLEIPDSTLYGWVSRGEIADVAPIIKKLPNARVSWLESGEGEMLRDAPHPPPTAPDPIPTLTPEQQMLLRAAKGLGFADMVKLTSYALELHDPDYLKTLPASKAANE